MNRIMLFVIASTVSLLAVGQTKSDKSDWINSMQFKPIEYKPQTIDIEALGRASEAITKMLDDNRKRFDDTFDKAVACFEKEQYAMAKSYFMQCRKMNSNQQYCDKKVLDDNIQLCESMIKQPQR